MSTADPLMLVLVLAGREDLAGDLGDGLADRVRDHGRGGARGRVALLPIARSRSQRAAAMAARSNTPGNSGWPNMTVADLRMPPHRGHGGSGSPARTRSRAPAMGVRSPQPVHTTSSMVPCSSMTRSAGVPARL